MKKILFSVIVITLFPLIVNANWAVGETDIDKYIVTSPKGYTIEENVIIPYGDEFISVCAEDSCSIVYNKNNYMVKRDRVEKSTDVLLSDYIFKINDLDFDPDYGVRENILETLDKGVKIRLFKDKKLYTNPSKKSKVIKDVKASSEFNIKYISKSIAGEYLWANIEDGTDSGWIFIYDGNIIKLDLNAKFKGITIEDGTITYEDGTIEKISANTILDNVLSSLNDFYILKNNKYGQFSSYVVHSSNEYDITINKDLTIHEKYDYNSKVVGNISKGSTIKVLYEIDLEDYCWMHNCENVKSGTSYINYAKLIRSGNNGGDF